MYYSSNTHRNAGKSTFIYEGDNPEYTYVDDTISLRRINHGHQQTLVYPQNDIQQQLLNTPEISSDTNSAVNIRHPADYRNNTLQNELTIPYTELNGNEIGVEQLTSSNVGSEALVDLGHESFRQTTFQPPSDSVIRPHVVPNNNFNQTLRYTDRQYGLNQTLPTLQADKFGLHRQNNASLKPLLPNYRLQLNSSVQDISDHRDADPTEHQENLGLRRPFHSTSHSTPKGVYFSDFNRGISCSKSSTKDRLVSLQADSADIDNDSLNSTNITFEDGDTLIDWNVVGKPYVSSINLSNDTLVNYDSDTQYSIDNACNVRVMENPISNDDTDSDHTDTDLDSTFEEPTYRDLQNHLQSSLRVNHLLTDNKWCLPHLIRELDAPIPYPNSHTVARFCTCSICKLTVSTSNCELCERFFSITTSATPSPEMQPTGLDVRSSTPRNLRPGDTGPPQGGQGDNRRYWPGDQSTIPMVDTAQHPGQNTVSSGYGTALDEAALDQGSGRSPANSRVRFSEPPHTVYEEHLPLTPPPPPLSTAIEGHQPSLRTNGIDMSDNRMALATDNLLVRTQDINTRAPTSSSDLASDRKAAGFNYAAGQAAGQDRPPGTNIMSLNNENVLAMDNITTQFSGMHPGQAQPGMGNISTTQPSTTSHQNTANVHTSMGQSTPGTETVPSQFSNARDKNITEQNFTVGENASQNFINQLISDMTHIRRVTAMLPPQVGVQLGDVLNSVADKIFTVISAMPQINQHLDISSLSKANTFQNFQDKIEKAIYFLSNQLKTSYDNLNSKISDFDQSNAEQVNQTSWMKKLNDDKLQESKNLIRSVFNTNTEMGHTPKYHVKQPDIFSNAIGDNLQEWLAKVKHFCKLCGLSGILKAQYVATLLQKSPFLEFEKLSVADKENADSIFSMLQTKFGIQGQSSLFATRLFNLQQNDMSVHDYFEKVVFYLNTLGITNEAQAIQHFLRGLKAPIRDQLELSNSKTLAECRDIALILESRLAHRKPITNTMIDQPVAVVHEVHDGRTIRENEMDQGVHEAQYEGVNQLDSQYSPNTYQAYNSPNRFQMGRGFGYRGGYGGYRGGPVFGFRGGYPRYRQPFFNNSNRFNYNGQFPNYQMQNSRLPIMAQSNMPAIQNDQNAQDNSAQYTGGPQSNVDGQMKCFICNSPDHFCRNCPHNTQNNSMTPRYGAQANYNNNPMRYQYPPSQPIPGPRVNLDYLSRGRGMRYGAPRPQGTYADNSQNYEGSLN